MGVDSEVLDLGPDCADAIQTMAEDLNVPAGGIVQRAVMLFWLAYADPATGVRLYAETVAHLHPACDCVDGIEGDRCEH